MQRGHRLSRSRDFDAVYRHGRSVSTRYLVLYWFERENGDENGPRLGIASPTLSFHLAQLRHAGLVETRRDGRSLIYAAKASIQTSFWVLRRGI